MTVFLHLGAHRTGSTHLQATLKENYSFLKEAGWDYCRFHDVPGARKLALQFQGVCEERAGKFRGRSTSNFDDCAAQMRRLYRSEILPKSGGKIVSYEGHLGRMHVGASGRIYPGFTYVIDFLHEVLPPDRKVGLSIRSYDQFIESTYKYWVRHGLARRFDSYQEDIDLKALDWRPIVNKLVDVFGESRVLVWSFERYMEDFGSFYRWLFGNVGVDMNTHMSGGLKVPSEEKNSSCSAVAYELEIDINRIVNRQFTDKEVRVALAKQINDVIESKLPARSYGKPVLFSEEQRKNMNAAYREHLEDIKRVCISYV